MRKALLVGMPALIAGVFLVAGGWYLHSFLGTERAPEALLARTPEEARILAAIGQMKSTGGIRFGVPEADGRRLRLLAEAAGAANAVEIGTSTGWSGLWLCLGMESTQGRLTTFELSPEVAAIARENFRRAGVEARVTVVVGDAHRNLASLHGPVDLVFLDADKEGYVDYLEQLLPRVRPGGLILAHNTRYAPEYMRRVTTDPALDTLLLTQSSGLAVTVKRRAR